MKLVVIDLSGALSFDKEALSLLPAGRREELLRLPAMSRIRSAFAELALRKELSAVVPRAKEAVFARSDRGKPYLEDHPEQYFSLSHSGGFAVCALSDMPVGVDVEQIKERDLSVATRFSAWEREQLAASEDPKRLFYRFWTARESALKLRGTGLSELKRVEIAPCGLLFDGEKFSFPLAAYSLRQGVMRLLPPEEGDHMLALCGAGEAESEFFTAEQLLAIY